MTERPPLRDRLLALRADVLRQLADADVLEPAWLTTLAGLIEAALPRLRMPETGRDFHSELS